MIPRPSATALMSGKNQRCSSLCPSTHLQVRFALAKGFFAKEDSFQHNCFLNAPKLFDFPPPRFSTTQCLCRQASTQTFPEAVRKTIILTRMILQWWTKWVLQQIWGLSGKITWQTRRSRRRKDRLLNTLEKRPLREHQISILYLRSHWIPSCNNGLATMYGSGRILFTLSFHVHPHLYFVVDSLSLLVF